MSKQKDTTKTFGLQAEDYQFLYELQITANNIRRHLATLLTMLARERFNYKETENLMFEVDWEKKQLVISEREDGDDKAEESR